MTRYWMVVLGGGLGAGFRFLIYTWVSKWYTATFPLATFLINLSGSFLIGLLMTLHLNRSSLNVNLRLFLVTGILGGYTTFSSFEWEIFLGLRGGAGAIALLYVVSSVVLGLAGVWLGAGICNYFWPNS